MQVLNVECSCGSRCSRDNRCTIMVDSMDATSRYSEGGDFDILQLQHKRKETSQNVDKLCRKAVQKISRERRVFAEQKFAGGRLISPLKNTRFRLKALPNDGINQLLHFALEATALPASTQQACSLLQIPRERVCGTRRRQAGSP